jgi:hypothetical protein
MKQTQQFGLKLWKNYIYGKSSNSEYACYPLLSQLFRMYKIDLLSLSEHIPDADAPYVCMYYVRAFRFVLAIIRQIVPSYLPFLQTALPPYSGQCLHIGSALHRNVFIFVASLFCCRCFCMVLIVLKAFLVSVSINILAIYCISCPKYLFSLFR